MYYQHFYWWCKLSQHSRLISIDTHFYCENVLACDFCRISNTHTQIFRWDTESRLDSNSNQFTNSDIIVCEQGLRTFSHRCGGVDHINPSKLFACGTVKWTVIDCERKYCPLIISLLTCFEFGRSNSIFNIQIELYFIIEAVKRNDKAHSVNWRHWNRFDLNFVFIFSWCFDWIWFFEKWNSRIMTWLILRAWIQKIVVNIGNEW